MDEPTLKGRLDELYYIVREAVPSREALLYRLELIYKVIGAPLPGPAGKKPQGQSLGPQPVKAKSKMWGG